MNRIAARFNQLKSEGKKAFIPYIMGGDPDLAKTAELIRMLADNGADLIEVGVPFSDPVADGPVIQQAGVRSLHNGCSLDKLLATIEEVNHNIDTPVILMIYYNMIFQRGFAEFFEKLKTAGCAGLIIPDLPPDEAGDLRRLATEYGIGVNFLVAPTSNEERITQVAEASTGFVYAVSLKGVTGARAELPPELPVFIEKIKKATSKPVAVGFGISSSEQAKMVSKLADGVIVGSAIVKAANQDPSLGELKELITKLRSAI